MNTLYSNFPEVYEMMYQTFINYDEEYSYYRGKLKNHNSQSVVELGSGTGHLASRFFAEGFDYSGIDLNSAMLEIATRKNPGIDFIEADMRNFQLRQKKDACIIAGRSSSYLFTNKDVWDAFNAINKNLNRGGILCFDFINAGKFIPLIKDGIQIIHRAESGGRKFHRESHWSVNDSESWAFNWAAVYFETDAYGKQKKIAEDNSVIRSFTKEDMSLFLELCNFKIIEIEERPSYAFDTLVIVAQKK